MRPLIPSPVVKAHIILFVTNQEASKAFYSGLLDVQPVLDVPGMTEFRINDGLILGLMPEPAIARLLGFAVADRRLSRSAPSSELYLIVDNANAYYERAIRLGASEVSYLQPRDWGHTVGYCTDLDGHLLALAETAQQG